jgi:hypothetical protein
MQFLQRDQRGKIQHKVANSTRPNDQRFSHNFVGQKLKSATVVASSEYGLDVPSPSP